MKKKIVLYGNCQLGAIYNILKNEYSNIYHITIITNFKLIWEKKPLPNDFYEADILIYQPLYLHGVYNTDNIINNMCKKECKKISISSLYFCGYYPDYYKNISDNLKTISKELPYGLFPYGLKYISDKKNLSPTKIVSLSKTHDFVSQNYIKDQLKLSFEKLYEKEQNTDIKCADFIKENYKKKKLFHTIDHPSNEILQKIINDLSIYLQLPKISLEKYDELLKDISIPIYPCVYSALQLTFDNSIFYCNREKYKYDDWIKKYIHVLFDSGTV